MSNEEKNENKREVTISPEDCNAALDFWRHFNVPISDDLQAAMDAFAAESTFENQQRVKLAITKAISTSDHECFKDELFSKIVEECSGVSFQMQFDKDFEDTVRVDE